MRYSKLLLIFILFLAFCLRLYRLSAPVADWHSWRQADTAAVSRNFLKFGFDLLHPRFDDLSNVPSGKENPEGYRFVEFPIYNLLHALAFKLFPFLSLEVWGRLISVLFSLVSLLFLYSLAKQYLGEKTALLSAFFFAVLPFNIYYSRVILPEPMMVAMSLGAIYFFEQFWLVSAFFASLAILLKPFSLFLVAPALFYLVIQKKLTKKLFLILLIYGFIVLLPFVWWRWWMSHLPEGIPASDWLFNAENIRFKGAWFYWLFAERLGKLILGYWGIALFVFGLVVRSHKKEGWFFYSWLLGMLIYFSVIAAGNVRHDYYQVLAVPVICVFLAKGSYFLLTAPRRYFNKIICHLLLIICLLFLFAFSWYQVRDFFNINNPAIVKAGKAVDRLVPKEAKVIAPYGGDTAFLYQTNRRGWPIGIEIEKFRKLGAEYYVNVNFDEEVKWLEKKYCVLEKTSEYIIIDLTQKCSNL